MATPSKIAFALGHKSPISSGRERRTLRAQRARHYAVLWCFLGNQTCRVSNSTPICNDCATLFFQSGAHSFLARAPACACARARAQRQEKGEDIQGSRHKGKGEMEFLNLSIVKSDVHFLVAGIFDFGGVGCYYIPMAKTNKIFFISTMAEIH